MTGRSGITVIMPAFNAAPWIGSAIESVLLQSETSWELLIVDDGSSDGTRDIADRYAAMDGRVRRTSNSRTKGAAGSRNTGLAEARSEYVFFLDSDDVLLPDSLELLRGLVRGSGFDAARGEMSFYCHQRWLAGEPAENSGRSEIRASGYPASGFTLHLYRKDFLAASGIVFPEGLGIGEDRVFLWQVYSRLSQIPVVHAPVYLYRLNHGPRHPSVAKSRDFLSGLARIRAHCAEKGRADMAAPLLDIAFMPEWLGRLHTVYMENRSEALAFLDGCGALLDGLEDYALPELRRQLGDSAVEFLEFCKKGDSEAMLALLERLGVIVPFPQYIGIPREPFGPGWHCYRASRRLRNMATPASLRCMAYLQRLRMRSARRLGTAAPGPVEPCGQGREV